MVQALKEAEDTVTLHILSRRRVEQPPPQVSSTPETSEAETPKLESFQRLTSALKSPANPLLDFSAKILSGGDSSPAPSSSASTPTASTPAASTPPVKNFVCQSVEVTKTQAGFGMDLFVGDKGIVIKSMVSSGAAYQTGRLEAGDMIVEINGKNVVGWPQDHVVALLKGSVTVRLLVVPKNQLL